MSIDLDGYVDVATRIAEFREQYPAGSLQPASIERPYSIETIGDRCFIVYTAAAYRTPDDARPGVGIAWEPFPGRTPYTRDSELQNAETSAWGRAIVAVLAADTKRGIASADEVRNRYTEAAGAPPISAGRSPKARTASNQGAPPSTAAVPSEPVSPSTLSEIRALRDELGVDDVKYTAQLAVYKVDVDADLTQSAAEKLLAAYVKRASK